MSPQLPDRSRIPVVLPHPCQLVDRRPARRRHRRRQLRQQLALTHAELILRPWDTSRPPVTAALTVTAPLPSLATGSPAGAEPAEVNARPITAAHVRELLVRLDAVCPGGLQAPPGGSLQIAVTDADGALLATASRPELERIARHGCREHPEPASANHGCGCAVLDRPPSVDRYRPTPAQRRLVKHRDRTCRHPGCGQPVGRIDLDHVVPHADGGPDRLRQPLLPVPPPPPAQDVRARLAVRPHR